MEMERMKQKSKSIMQLTSLALLIQLMYANENTQLFGFYENNIIFKTPVQNLDNARHDKLNHVNT